MSENVDAQTMWNTMYRESDRVWSGRPNLRLVEVVSDFVPGRALDLGCGEGGDPTWLAARGWSVVAVDISDEALRRAASDAGELSSRIDFQHHDLTRTFPDGEFELVSAHFLHSPTEWDRARLLRRAAAAVAPGGVLLIVDHGAGPPWESRFGDHHHHVFQTPQEVVDELALDPALWDILRLDSVGREVTGPQGQVAVVPDNVIVLRRST